MKWTRRMAAMAACVLTACLVAGCGAKQDLRKPFVGTWELSSMTMDGELTEGEDLDLLKSFGLNIYVVLNEDGTGEMDLYGDVTEGTWEATAENKATLTFEDTTDEVTLADGVMTMEDEGDVLQFVQIDPADRVAYEDDDALELDDTDDGDAEEIDLDDLDFEIEEVDEDDTDEDAEDVEDDADASEDEDS